MNKPDPLAQLRDIHSPEAIPFWPPAPGWWVLALMALVCAILITRFLLRRQRDRIYRIEALKKLDDISATQQHSNKIQYLFLLLRQTANTAAREENIASLPTAAFLEFLRESSNQSLFLCDPQKLGMILYATPDQYDLEYCAELCTSLESDARLWIKQHRVRGMN